VFAHLALSVSRERRFAVGAKDTAGQSGNWATTPFHVFLQHKALSDRRRDDAIPEPLGQLS
jgi:hypothetical protein